MKAGMEVNQIKQAHFLSSFLLELHLLNFTDPSNFCDQTSASLGRKEYSRNRKEYSRNRISRLIHFAEKKNLGKSSVFK